MQVVHVSRSAFRGWLCGIATGGALILAGSFGLGLMNSPAAVDQPSVPINAGSNSSGAGMWAIVVPSDERTQRMSEPATATQTSTSSTGNSDLDPQGTQQCYTPAFSSGPGERDLSASGSLLSEMCRNVGPGEPR